jgi:membrane-associated phospholipid phosphatase
VQHRRPALNSLILLGVLAAQPGLAYPQNDSLARHLADSARAPDRVREARQQAIAKPHVVRGYEVAIAVGGVGALMLLDRPVQRFVQQHRSQTTDDIAGFFRQEGEAPYYAGLSLGVLGVGLATSNPGLRRAGGRLVTSVAISAVETGLLKRLLGRSRPNEDVGAFAFHPFTSLADSAGIETRGSMPSGHTTAAFAVATSLADDVKSPVLKVLLFTLASGTAFSRVNDNRHWLSDTGLGALLGITTAKVVGGHWRIFGLHPPGFLVTPTGGAALSWDLSF